MSPEMGQLERTPTLSETKKLESALNPHFRTELTIFCCMCSASLSTRVPITGVLSFAEIVDTGSLC